MKAFYEDVWAELPEDPRPWGWERRRALLLAEAKPGERVLDLGCGAGRFVAALQDAGADPVGVELAEAALERARRNVPGAELHALARDGAIPLEDASVDLVWCSEVLEHVPDTAGLLSEVRRVLRTGGRLLLTTPSHDLPRRALIAVLRFDGHFDPLGQHVRFYSRRSLARVLGEFAFEDVHVSHIGGLPGLRGTLVAHARKARLVP
jgi:SAM-dependent methyltransferase